MKVAVAGKGGSGKTSISGTMARLLARDGHAVLAIDADSNPNLALTLGIPAERMSAMPTLPHGLVERTENGAQLSMPLADICRSHSMAAADGVTLLVMAHPQHAGTGCLCSMHATVRTLIEAAANGADDVCILDTEASPEHLSRGTARYVETMLIVVEPYYKSLETGRRMALLGRDLGLQVALAANKIRDEGEADVVREFAAKHDIPIVGVIPFDAELPKSERAQQAPLDFAPEAPAIAAIAQIARQLAHNGRA